MLSTLKGFFSNTGDKLENILYGVNKPIFPYVYEVSEEEVKQITEDATATEQMAARVKTYLKAVERKTKSVEEMFNANNAFEKSIMATAERLNDKNKMMYAARKEYKKQLPFSVKRYLHPARIVGDSTANIIKGICQ
jgi:Mg2+ and Co2+ transporter CorA